MEITPGRYHHYKGQDYEVIGVGRHSEALESLVLYRALYRSPEFGDNSLWARPLSMFTENITIEGKTMPRFARLP
jgi:hypothetical protein